jgi:hypothetical protein
VLPNALPVVGWQIFDNLIQWAITNCRCIRIQLIASVDIFFQ